MEELNEYVHWSQKKPNDSFFDYSLIMPDISIGNVGQLAVDLLLNNLKVEHLAHIYHPCFLPFVGRNPFDLEGVRLESSCEIYECKEKKLVLVQIRSPVSRRKYSEFKAFLLKFIKSFNFKQTVVVSSSSSEYFSAEQLQSVSLYYLSTPNFTITEELKTLKWKEFSLPSGVISGDLIPGSFISEGLLEDCEKEHLPLIVLICVCSEGDNYPEAFHMVNCINLWFKLKEDKVAGEMWKIPISWKLPYGSAAPPEMY